MGVTIFYRGSLDNLDRVEDFEDRVLDLALELGGQARIWRTANNDDPRRMVRGVILDLFPGQETTSLLIAPEGWLIGLTEIEAAEKGELAGPPSCFVKTQFGPVEGHVALVELFTVLKREFFSNLQVHDDGDYWETRDLAVLTAKMHYVKSAIDGLTEGLSRHGLSSEAAEDPEIVAARIERIAQMVHRTLGRPAEHPPVRWEDEESDDGDAGDSEPQWDASYKENRRQQERMQRAIEERLARGADVGEAFDAAMLEETSLGLPDEPSSSEARDEWLEDAEGEDEEPWRESLPAPLCEADKEDEGEDFLERPGHPLQERVMELSLRLHKLFGSETGAADSHRDVLLHGAGDMLGGLAQAIGGLSQFSSDENGTAPFADDYEPDAGLAVVQLKRALRGAAFASGALFPLRSNGTLDEAAFKELHATIRELQTDIFAELHRLSQRIAGEG